ncbi:hypothetical protein EVAR_57433_1 [Eumeta japonica]|uniref:Uncharacterized protein n=1 Tax=Eumeta variegata TaxID=151549 RepID=A0A4C1YA23_EUMVA|nr:hypothetical protein EVAR_57433_1 [Eumeta japonica]
MQAHCESRATNDRRRQHDDDGFACSTSLGSSNKSLVRVVVDIFSGIRRMYGESISLPRSKDGLEGQDSWNRNVKNSFRCCLSSSKWYPLVCLNHPIARSSVPLR